MALRTLVQIALINMSALVAHGIGDVEREVVATLLGSHLQQLQLLLLGQVLLKVHVQGRTTSEVLDIWCAMQFELVKYGE